MQIYFPFADSAFGYNCQQCGFRCCKGAGFFPTVAEHGWLNERYPSLALFTINASKASEDHVMAVANHDCFFLGESGYCDVHVKHGRERKPLFCRMFPAVLFTQIGDTLVVDLHQLCPIQPFRGQPGDFALRHDEIRADIASGFAAISSLATPGKLDAEGTPRLEEAQLVYEAWLRDLVHGDPEIGLFEYCAIDAWSLREQRAMTRPDSASLAADIADMRARMQAIASLLLADAEVDAGALKCERLLLSLAARVRFLSSQRLPDTVLARDAHALYPRILLALAVYLEVVAATNGAAIAPSTIDQALSQSLALFALLARCDEVPVFSSPPFHAVVLSPPRAIEDDLLAVVERIHGNAERGETLAEIVATLGQRLQRTRVLRNLAELLPHMAFSSRPAQE